MGETRISLNGIHKSFDNVRVLNGVSLVVGEGEHVSVLGPSGCGKSTLMNILTGIMPADSGDIFIKGQIGYMQQKDLLLPWKTVMENVALPRILRGKKKEAACREALPYFKTFQLEGYEDKYPYEMSGGMRQRASFLRTFLVSGDIMLLDEPFGAVDYITRGLLQNWLLAVSKELNLTILFITHDIEEAILLSDRVYVLDDKPSTVREEITMDFYTDDKTKRPVAKEFVDYKKRILDNLRYYRGENI